MMTSFAALCFAKEQNIFATLCVAKNLELVLGSHVRCSSLVTSCRRELFCCCTTEQVDTGVSRVLGLSKASL